MGSFDVVTIEQGGQSFMLRVTYDDLTGALLSVTSINALPQAVLAEVTNPSNGQVLSQTFAALSTITRNIPAGFQRVRIGTTADGDPQLQAWNTATNAWKPFNVRVVYPAPTP